MDGTVTKSAPYEPVCSKQTGRNSHRTDVEGKKIAQSSGGTDERLGPGRCSDKGVAFASTKR